MPAEDETRELLKDSSLSYRLLLRLFCLSSLMFAQAAVAQFCVPVKVVDGDTSIFSAASSW